MTDVELPGGDTISFPDDMSPDAINAAVRSHLGVKAPPSIGSDPDSAMGAVAASNLGEPDPRPLREVIADAMSRYGEGVAGGVVKAGAAMDATRDRGVPDQYRLTPDQVAEVERRDSDLRGAAATYEKRKPELGWPGVAGEMTPEMLASMYPVARAGTAMAPLASRLIGKTAAPFAADVLANAGYEGGKGYATHSESPMMDALKGAGGAAAGRVVGNVAGRLTGGITSQARELLRQGITPTYGQAFGNEGIVAASERALAGLPLAGPAVDAAKRRAMGQYSEAEVEQALKGTGIPHEGSGFESVRKANDTIHQGYEEVKPQTFLPPQDANQAVQRAAQAIQKIPLLTAEQQSQVVRYYQQKIVPEIQGAAQAGTVIDGITARKLDVELGELARKHVTSPNPADHPLGAAFGELQFALKDALKANDPAVLQRLQALHAAYRGMVPINIATERAASARGAFTPNQFRSAATQSDIPGYSPRLALNDAARESLNEPGTGLTRSLSRNLGVPGLGALGAAGVHMAGVPAEAIAAGSAAIAAGGTGVAHALYSEPGIRAMLFAMDLFPSTAQWIFKQAPEKQQEFVLRMLAQNPVQMKQIAAQVGRQLAAQQGGQ